MSCEVTYEELAGFAAGDLSQQRRGTISRHMAACPTCRRRLEALHAVDATLANIPAAQPSTGTILAARRLLTEEIRPKPEPGILTLEEVAAFLRIDMEQLAIVAAELPAFELAGQIRVRRSRLLEWVEQREQQFARGSAARSLARQRLVVHTKGAAL